MSDDPRGLQFVESKWAPKRHAKKIIAQSHHDDNRNLICPHGNTNRQILRLILAPLQSPSNQSIHTALGSKLVMTSQK